MLRNIPCIDCGITQIRQDKEIQSFHVAHQYIVTFMVFNSTMGENLFGTVGRPLFQSNPLFFVRSLWTLDNSCTIFLLFYQK